MRVSDWLTSALNYVLLELTVEHIYHILPMHGLVNRYNAATLQVKITNSNVTF
jgi:hypothetical protein